MYIIKSEVITRDGDTMSIYLADRSSAQQSAAFTMRQCDAQRFATRADAIDAANRASFRPVRLVRR